MQRLTSPTTTALGVGLVLALTAVACGGSSAPEQQTARQIAEALEGIDGLDDVEIEGLDDLLGGDGDGDGNISFSSEAGGMAMGTDLPRPGWLPAGFPLPEGGSITATAIEADESGAAMWLDVPGTVEQIRTDQIDALEAWGARLLTPRDEAANQLSLVFASPDGRTLRTGYGDVGETVFVTIEFTTEDIEVAEAAAAGPQEGPGRATVVIDATTFTAEGTCRIDAASASFDTTGGGDTITIWLQDDGTGQLLPSASVTRISEDSMASWILADPEASDASLSPTDGTFSIRGEFIDLVSMGADGSSSAVPGSADVTCR